MTRKIRLQEIADKVGCSQSTVSHAFNNPKLVNRKTRQEILQVCQDLGYNKKRYFKQRKKVIGITGRNLASIFGPYYKGVTEAILAEAKKQGINVIIEPLSEDTDLLPYMFAKKLLDGVIIYWEIPQEQVMMIKEADIPLVICGYPLPGLEVDTVLSDGRAGMYAIAKHLIELGHKRFGYIAGGQLLNQITSDRLDGFKYGLREVGLSLKDEWITTGDFGKWESASQCVDRLMGLKTPPTAIVCENDPLAFVAIQRLKEKGYKVPQDVSVTGFDNTPFIPGIDYPQPKLTTVDVNLVELGKLTATVLFDIIEQKSRVACRHTLPVQLIKGKTTAAAAA